MQTTVCYKCGRPARSQCGHITHRDRQISAGWCSEECRESMPSKGGWFGEWSPSIPLRARGKPATATACDCGPECEVWRLDHRAEYERTRKMHEDGMVYQIKEVTSSGGRSG